MPTEAPSRGSVSTPLLDQPTSKKEDIAAFIDRIVMEGDGRLFPLRWQAFEGIRYYSGELNAVWNPTLRRYTGTKPAGDWFWYPQINQVLAPVDIAMVQFLKNEPQAYVVPQDETEENRDGARAADRIRQFINDEQFISRRRREATLGMVLTGDHFSVTMPHSTFRDSEQHEEEVNVPQQVAMTLDGRQVPAEEIPLYRGNLMVDQRTGQPIMQTVMTPSTVMMPSTDVGTEYFSKFEMILDFDAASIDDVRWYCTKKIKSLEWIGDNFGSAARDAVVKDGVEVGVASYQWMFFDVMLRGINSSPGAPVQSAWDLRNSAIVKMFVQRPTAKYPKGRLIIASGKTILYSEANPWALVDNDPQQLGLVQYGYHPLLGTPWHFGLPKNVMDLNRRLIGVHAGMIHHRRTMAYGQWLMPKGAGVLNDKMTGKPGLVVEFDARKTGGVAPQKVAGTQMDAAVIEEESLIRKLIKEIAGTEEVLQGQQPYAGMPGISLDMLAEKAGARFVALRQAYEETVAQEDTLRLRMLPYTRRWTKEQMVRVVGKDRMVSVDMLTAGSMRGNFDVRCEIGTKRATSQVAWKAQLLDLADRGFIDMTNPANQVTMLEEFGASMFLTPEAADIKMARWENQQLDKGIPVEIKNYENDELHLSQHELRTKDPAYLKLPQQVRDLYDQHIYEHQLRFQMIQEQAANTAVGPEDGAGQQGGFGSAIRPASRNGTGGPGNGTPPTDPGQTDTAINEQQASQGQPS